MTYTVKTTVDIDCGDHGFMYEKSLKTGIKTITKAERCMKRICSRKKYVKDLMKEFDDRHAVKLKAHAIIVDEDNVQVSEYYWEHNIWQSKEKIFQ